MGDVFYDSILSPSFPASVYHDACCQIFDQYLLLAQDCLSALFVLLPCNDPVFHSSYAFQHIAGSSKSLAGWLVQKFLGTSHTSALLFSTYMACAAEWGLDAHVAVHGRDLSKDESPCGMVEMAPHIRCKAFWAVLAWFVSLLPNVVYQMEWVNG